MYFSFHLIPLFAGSINLALAIFVFFVSPKRRLNQVFCALNLGLAWWNFGVYGISMIHSAPAALIWARGILMGVIILPALIYHFAIETTGIKGSQKKVLLAYGVALVFLLINITPLFIAAVRPYNGSFRLISGPAFYVFCATFFLATAVGTIGALFKYTRSPRPSSARAVRFLFIAVSILLLGGLHDMIPVMGGDYYPGTRVPIISWGAVAASLYGLIIGYSILSEQLFDVRISISRHSAMVLRLCFLAGIAYVLMLSVGTIFRGTFTGQGLVASLAVLIISAAITAKIFPKLFGGVGGRLEQAIIGDHFEYQDKIAAFIYSPQESENLQRLLDEATELVLQQLSLSAAGIAIVGGDPKTRGKSTRVAARAPEWGDLLNQDSPLVQFFRTSTIDVVDTKNDSSFFHGERAVVSCLKAASLELAFCIGPRSKDPLGVLVVGSKRDGRPLARTDVELLSALCRSLVFRVERIAIVQNEGLRQANSAKDRFLASINHEIRNPLNGITGIVQMLSETKSDSNSTYLLATLKACTEQLRSSMDDVLDFTQIESDSITVNLSQVNLTELIKTTCAGNDITAKQLVYTGTSEADVFVKCDAGKVRQIVSNYVINAQKYGSPPGAEISLLVNGNGLTNSGVTITVTSTGPTLSPAEVGMLFTPLTRGQRARETNAHGTGLGLALCKKLAHAMGGTVGVDSKDGKTAFWFKAVFDAATGAAPEAVLITDRYSGRRALAIEDESYNRHVLGHFLKKFGIAATWAENGSSALAAASNESFDVILMDWLLPDVDGAELLQRIKKARGANLPPVIVLSAYSTSNKKAECLAAGAVAFISKPIDPDKLSAALDLCGFGASPGPSVT